MLDNWSIFSGKRSVSSVPSGKAANASFVGALFYVLGEYDRIDVRQTRRRYTVRKRRILWNKIIGYTIMTTTKFNIKIYIQSSNDKTYQIQ